MGGGGDDIGIGHGAHVLAAGHEACDVRHVHHEKGAIAVGNLAQGLEVDGAGIGRSAGHQELWLVLAHHVLQVVIVNAAGLGVDAVADGVIDLAGEVHRRAVGEMAAAGQVHAHEGYRRAAKAPRRRPGWPERRSGAGTLANSAPKRSIVLLMATRSISSTYSQPP